MLKDAALVLVLVALTGCRTGRNYSGLEGPRYTGGSAATVLRPGAGQRLRVVSFNIAFARHVEAAIAVLQSDPAVGEADVILLQEMDEAGTRRVAHAFAMAYVYYPGTFHLRTRRDFGNAVLSRWPIVDHAKILLPHLGVLGRKQRIATGATVSVSGSLVRVYSTHLSTMIGATAAGRREQLAADPRRRGALRARRHRRRHEQPRRRPPLSAAWVPVAHRTRPSHDPLRAVGPHLPQGPRQPTERQCRHRA